VERLGQRPRDDLRAQGREVGGELVHAGLVGAGAEPDPDGAVVIERVAAVEGAGRLEVGGGRGRAGLLGADGLGFALVGAGAGHGGESAHITTGS